MNWLIIAFPLAGIYIIWFGYLLFKKKYTKPMLYFALAHLPYLFVNLVAPFRGVLDPNYAGYSIGWIVLPKGISVLLVVGLIVVLCLVLASRSLMDKMKGWWIYAFIFDLFLSIFVALPILLDVLADISAFTLELGEYLKISGYWVALLIFILFSGPTFYACYFAGKNVIQKMQARLA